MKRIAQYRTSLVVGLVFLLATLVTFGYYHANTLEGDIDNHILSSQMFGVPQELQAHGLKPMYGSEQSGWDGQFYYYMSNDIMGVKDTAKHIDAPSYRYQRIGLSLYAAAVAALTGSEWVSPALFFFSYLFLIFAATVAGARLLQRVGAHPAWILLWSFSVGTQITLFNALPDAAADAFLILALALLFSGRRAWSIVPFTMAALSREVYAAFPAAVLLFVLIDSLRYTPEAGRPTLGSALRNVIRSRYYLLTIPAIVAVLWNLRVTRHFGASPASQAHGILGKPLGAWSDSLAAAWARPGMPEYHLPVHPEVIALVLFVLVLAATLFVAVRVLRAPAIAPEMRGVALTAGFFALLYASFGLTVTGHYTGYFKAAAVFFYLIPLMMGLARPNDMARKVVYALLLAALVFTNAYNLTGRILAKPFNEDKYTHMSSFKEARRFECFGNYDAKIHVNAVHMIKATRFAGLFGRSDRLVVNVALTNTGTHPFISSRNFGSVFMSFHWVDAAGKVVLDGTRSALLQPIEPGATANVDVITAIPKGAGPVTLKLSPVQEGCAWFYMANPAVASDVPITFSN
jgi:hypothetical protein